VLDNLSDHEVKAMLVIMLGSALGTAHTEYRA